MPGTIDVDFLANFVLSNRFLNVSSQITKVSAVVLSFGTGTSIIAAAMSSVFWISSLFVALMLIHMSTMIVCPSKLPKHAQ